MKITSILLFCSLLILLLFFVIACQNQQNHQKNSKTTTIQEASGEQLTNFINITPLQFRNKMALRGGAVVIDARTPAELNATGYIPEAKNINFHEANFRQLAKNLEGEGNKPILIYCAKGGRSSKMCAKLSSLGVDNLHNLEGGIGAWLEAGYDLSTKK